MTVERAPLSEAVVALSRGDTETTAYVAERYRRVDAVESDVRAWVEGPKRREWLTAEAAALAERYPDVDDRPPLYGVPVGVKDIFHVDGLPTRAGSGVPPGELVGPEAAVVTALRRAGALVMGKTVTTEFAYFEPGPTRNPHDLAHTPGGSSSGSAAAVAAGMCPLALGTQTIGSIIRPASFCGVVGFKPSYGRIPLDGVIPLSPSLDHVGLFTQDVAGMHTAAAVCVDGWEAPDEPVDPDDPDDADRPVLGVPDGPYISQASDAGSDAFERDLATLDAAGFEIRRVEVDAFERIEEINERHTDLMAAEAALAHREWFEAYPERYADSTAELLREGRDVSVGRVADARAGRIGLRESLAATATEHGIDVWISPGAPGPAPEGIDTTGDPVMNLPWTHAGVPAVAIPAGTVDGLPVGVQCASAFGTDERLLTWRSSFGRSYAALVASAAPASAASTVVIVVLVARVVLSRRAAPPTNDVDRGPVEVVARTEFTGNALDSFLTHVELVCGSCLAEHVVRIVDWDNRVGLINQRLVHSERLTSALVRIAVVLPVVLSGASTNLALSRHGDDFVPRVLRVRTERHLLCGESIERPSVVDVAPALAWIFRVFHLSGTQNEVSARTVVTALVLDAHLTAATPVDLLGLCRPR